jgi:hypothetical protein
MKLFTAVSLLPYVALASPSLSARQVAEVAISNPTVSGCSLASPAQISPDKQSITFTFNSFNVALPTPGDRSCTVQFNMNFPLTCTAVRFNSVYRGSALIPTGAVGDFSAAYVLSPTTNPLAVLNPKEQGHTTLTSAVYNPRHDLFVEHNATSVIRGKPNEQRFIFKADPHLILQNTAGSPSIRADIVVNSATFSLKDLRTVPTC